jgi:hypothetical protein
VYTGATGGSRKGGERSAREAVYLEARRRRGNKGFIDVVQSVRNASSLHDEARRLPETLGCTPKGKWWTGLAKL